VVVTRDEAAGLRHRLDADGYCVIDGFLDEDEVAGLRAATRRYPGQLKGTVSPEYRVTWDGGESIQQILHAEKLCAPLNEVIRSDRTLGVLRALRGYDLALYHVKFILKGPGGHEVPWHQDFGYWSGQSDVPCQINCMVYLDDADEDNGCLLVVPGSHRGGLARHEFSASRGAFDAGLPAVDPATARPLPGRAGTAILFGPLLHHASGANRTTRPRHSFTAVYTNPLVDVHREVLSRFFPRDRIGELTGVGPFRFCPEHYQRRNLWHLAADHVASRAWDWIEVTDRTFNDGSFEWLSARKDPRSVYHRYEQVPLVSSNRDDVEVRSGLLTDRLHDLSGPFGLVFIDCERPANARAALSALERGLRAGTVIVLDDFYDGPGDDWGTYRPFQDFITDRWMGFDYLARSPQQVAIRLTDGEPCRCPPIRWRPVSEGIVYG
jgi:phytanoyl-CoA hydroxylase